MQQKRPVVIVGGGVSGLSMAYRLHQKGVPFLLLEASARFGGNIVTAEHDGYLYDLGPDSFLKAKVAGVELCRDLGLESELIAPSPGGASVWVAQDGALHAMPEGLSLGVPKRPGPLLETPLLSGQAKFRAMLEPFVKRPDAVGEESILEFTSRRLGHEMASRLAAPLLSGVFAGNAADLSMDAAFPQLIALEKKYGSLFSGMNGGKSIWNVLTSPVVSPPSPFTTLRRGLGSLIDALVAALPAECLRTEMPVQALRCAKGTSGAVLSVGDEQIEAEHVIFAGPPWAAAQLLGGELSELAQPLREIRGYSTATVFFGLELSEAQHSLQGSGFIVPPGQADILAATFISSKWAGRAPAGKALVRAFVGGASRDIRGENDEELTKIAHRELTRLLGGLGPIQFSRVHRYERGTPQPELGHLKRLEIVKSQLGEFPWLSLIGSGYGGVGIPDCLRQAQETAEKFAAN